MKSGLISILMLAVLFVSAQEDFSGKLIVLSDKILEKDGILLDAIDCNDGSYCVITGPSTVCNPITIMHFDNSDNLLSEKIISLVFNSIPGRFCYAKASNNELNILFEAAEKSSKKVYLINQKISLSDLNPIGSARQITSIQSSSSVNQKFAYYDFQDNDSKTKLLVISHIQNEELLMLDDNFAELWNSSRKEYTFYPNYVVDEDGNAFTASSVRGTDYYDRILKIDFFNTDGEHTQINAKPVEGKINPNNVMLDVCVLSNGNFLVCGFYDNNTGGNNGRYQIEFDPVKKEVTSNVCYMFSNELLAANAYERFDIVNKTDMGVCYFEVRDAIPLDNGEYLFMAEYDVVVGKIRHQRKDVMMIRCNSEGEEIWFANIPKFQVTETTSNGTITKSSNVSSYAAIRYKDNLILIFNDHKANLKAMDHHPELEKMEEKGSDAVVTAVTINESGKVTRTMLSSYETLPVFPEFAKAIALNELGKSVVMLRTETGNKIGVVGLKE